MDEDANGNFRILTKTTQNWATRATQLFIFDKDFKIAGQLLDIEP
jgi:hypothetical protein